MANNGNEEILKERIEKQEEQVIKLESNVLQLANYYFVFQGVIFTAIFSAPSPLKCHYRLVPLLLSLTAATLNLISLFMIGRKYTKSLRRLEWEYQLWYTKVNEVREHDRDGEDGARRRQVVEEEKQLIMGEHVKKWKREFVFWVCMFLFVSFAVINLYATWVILCHKP